MDGRETERQSTGCSDATQFIHDLDRMAHALRNDDRFDRFALAAALDGIRAALTGFLASLDLNSDILKAQRELCHAVVEKTGG